MKIIVIFLTIIKTMPQVQSAELIIKQNIETEIFMKEYCSSKNLSRIGEIDKSQYIKINNIDNPLYCTFESQEKALENIKKEANMILNLIRLKYNLEEINSKNWQDYRKFMYIILDDNLENLNETNFEFQILREFFDIYENEEENEKIVNYILKSNKKTLKNDIKIGKMFPYYSPIAKENESVFLDEKKLETKTINNISSAVNYAIKYAENRNTPNYYSFNGGDCTNFTSQILEASGVRQIVYDSEHSGWWHKYNPKALFSWDKHKHSRSWSVADVFARYMGVSYKTKDHYSFSSNIQKGDFIGADWTSDGNWDHTAFVTQKNTSTYTINGKTYYDYKVAQHSDDYNEWVTSTRNGWENVNNSNWTYARIR